MKTCENESSEKTSLRRGLYFTGGMDFPPGILGVLTSPQAYRGFYLRRGSSLRHQRTLPPKWRFPPENNRRQQTIFTPPSPPNDPIRSRYRTRLSVRNPAFCNACLLAPSPDVSSSSPFESWVLALGRPDLKVLCCICMPPTLVPCT